LRHLQQGRESQALETLKQPVDQPELIHHVTDPEEVAR